MRTYIGTYILLGKLAIPEPDSLKWAKWFETADRMVAKTDVGGLCISTVFLGLDHSFGDGLPVLFETMVFRRGNWLDRECHRYGSWDEAEKGHNEVVARLRADIKNKVND